ncbi:MAG: hypothetical protein HN368_21085 [Spirochaetales bacterium]|nr:hypothetical protein [Spirochaetales bacterium]
MKRSSKLRVKTALVTILLIVLLSGVALAAGSAGPMGPAPNSGDGIPDGSGFDVPNGSIGESGLGSGPIGPAPNSGDGIPDGSGF